MPSPILQLFDKEWDENWAEILPSIFTNSQVEVVKAVCKAFYAAGRLQRTMEVVDERSRDLARRCALAASKDAATAKPEASKENGVGGLCEAASREVPLPKAD
jgi:hypothetical protein